MMTNLNYRYDENGNYLGRSEIGEVRLKNDVFLAGIAVGFICGLLFSMLCAVAVFG
jgi:hypothetical protein